MCAYVLLCCGETYVHMKKHEEESENETYYSYTRWFNSLRLMSPIPVANSKIVSFNRWLYKVIYVSDWYLVLFGLEEQILQCIWYPLSIVQPLKSHSEDDILSYYSRLTRVASLEEIIIWYVNMKQTVCLILLWVWLSKHIEGVVKCSILKCHFSNEHMTYK